MSPVCCGSQANGICALFSPAGTHPDLALVTDFLHSLHSPPRLIKEDHIPPHPSLYAVCSMVPNPVTYLAHQHPCLHLQPTLE